jgi:hypothetical protein
MCAIADPFLGMVAWTGLSALIESQHSSCRLDAIAVSGAQPWTVGAREFDSIEARAGDAGMAVARVAT